MLRVLLLSTTLLLSSQIIAAAPASAADLTFSGNFAKDNDVLRFDFGISSAQTISVISSSWLSASGGGFDPILSIFDSAGVLVASQDDGGKTGSFVANGTTFDFGVWDSNFDVALAAGNYSAIVTQYNNFPQSTLLSDGFRWDSNPNFTFTQSYGGATQPFFNGVWDGNDPRTSFWRFSLLNVDSAVVIDPNPTNVPEPGTLALFGTGLVGLLTSRRRRRG